MGRLQKQALKLSLRLAAIEPPLREVLAKMSHTETNYSSSMAIVIKMAFANVDSAVKGTVSPDTGLHFRVWKIKSVLSIGLLLVLTFFPNLRRSNDNFKIFFLTAPVNILDIFRRNYQKPLAQS
jgi:hypothetical protein